MGVSQQEVPKSFADKDLKKPGSKKLRKKSLVFLAFAIIVFYVGDAGLLWLAGGSKSQYGVSGFQGDTFIIFSAVMFCISNWIYNKYFHNSAKVSVEEKSNPDEVPEDAKTKDGFQQSATTVVDCMKVKGPPEFGKKRDFVPRLLKYARMDPSALNPKAKKFVPTCPLNTLDSDAPVFIPNAYVKKEEKLLKAECDGDDAGAVIYRSRHWLQEISLNKKEANGSSKTFWPPELSKKTPKLVSAKDAWKKSRSLEAVPAKKWQPKACAKA